MKLNEAARIAADLKLKALSCLQEYVNGKGINESEILSALMSADALRLFKEVEDRAHGTPKQAVDHTSSDGSMTPQAPSEVSDKVVAALVAKLTE